MRQHHGQRRTETIDYLQSMLGQMRGMAEAENCGMLAYLIEMAYLEATDLMRGQPPSRIAQNSRITQNQRHGTT